MKPPPDSFVDAVQRRLVISGDQDFELRDVLEKILTHEPGGDGIAAGQRLDLAFVPAAPAFGFLGDDEADAAQIGEFGGMPII